ncbi:MAG: hypothetical protein QF561_04020 [Phycisphaerales bacterium]|nr:hypothetical protein [Phycisphaerales bacterium]
MWAAILTAVTANGPVHAPDPPQEPAPETTPETVVHAERPLLRCIVHYDGRHRLCGEVIEELEHAIRMRDDQGDEHLIEVERIVAIEQILEVPAPTEGVVELLDGRQFRGLIKRDDCDTIELMMHGVPLEIERTRVAQAWLLEPVASRYAQLKPMMPLERPGAHLSLCRWLVAEKEWDLAVAELEAHTAMHRSSEANRLLRVARAHQKLKPAGGPAPNDQAPPETPEVPPIEPVDNAAVNLVRVYEIDLNDPPQLQISEEARRRFLEAYDTSALLPTTQLERQQLIDGPALDFLKLMFAHRAREFYGDVVVPAEPSSLRRFRQSVHDLWLIPRCATAACHGGADAGRFRLLRRSRLNNQIRTTNLLILDELVVDGRPMIDWDEPANSTLIQYALPRAHSSRPHPPVTGWRPALVAPQSLATQATIRWIESMMRNPRPDYPVESPLPPATAIDPGPRTPR